MIKVFDGHSDLFEDVYEKRKRGVQGVIEHLHAPKWEAGNCAGGFCPIWVDPFLEVYSIPVEQQYEGIVQQLENELYGNPFAKAVTGIKEYRDAIEDGKHAMILGSEGLSYLHGDYGKIELLFEKNFRIFSLTWNEENEFAEGAMAQSRNGLSDCGRQAIKRMEELGGIIDLAHSSRKTFFDAVKVVTRPFVVSHGNIDSILQHPRNITDEQLKVIRDCNGVMGISAYPPFIGAAREEQTLQRFCDNIKYVADKIGVEYVGLGFDFVDFLDDYGTDASISESLEDLEGIHQAQNVYKELKKQGFSEDELEKIFHANFERILSCCLK